MTLCCPDPAECVGVMLVLADAFRRFMWPVADLSAPVSVTILRFQKGHTTPE